MTTQLLATELANLIQESKRKHNDLRQAAEKSLDELKSIRTTSEAPLAAELAQRVNFVNPFIIACGTKNAKFTGIAVVCLSRLILVGALPWSKLSPVLEALREATSAGLDVQLKILQALPTLLQNYANDIKGDLLVTALNICFILQTSKNGVVGNTSAATLQQLIMTVFEKVTAEDKSTSNMETVGEAPIGDGKSVQLRSAAMDSHRVFKDICLMTENHRPEYLRFTGLQQTFGLELIESVLGQYAGLFLAHPEQAYTLRTRVIPFIIKSLNGKPNFATSVRLVRILYTMLKKHLSILPSEGGDALDTLTQLLDHDTSIWRRALCMEVFRGIFAEPTLMRRIFTLYDTPEGERSVLKNLTATFVRVSTEKPAVIGLGHQSTIPVADPYANMGASSDQAMLESSGVTGIIGGSVNEGHNTGISTQWSTVRVACIDQLDKTEPPTIPESYVYALTLSCITSLSEGLAKFILPLTVPGDTRSRKRGAGRPDTGRDSPAPTAAAGGSESTKSGADKSMATTSLDRSSSFKKNPVPVNPLALKDHPLYADIKICADIIEECWPAILATCSTFLYAALDSEYYHGLVRAFQKFAHVAGLLQLSTPRDAFLTTLGKAAVPPNVFTACLNATSSKPAAPSPTTEAPNTILNNARGLLSVENLVTPVGAAGERQRQASFDASSTPQTINTRNLLCMRALLNLGIALGPTLGSSWSIILETLQQADLVLFTNGKAPGRIPIVTKVSDSRAESEAAALLASFSTEIRAVETAASRLLESTVDFPNDAFVEIATAVCHLLEHKQEPISELPIQSRSPLPPTAAAGPRPPNTQHRKVSGLAVTAPSRPNQQDQFALAKIGDLAIINLDRLFLYPPDVSGWDQITSELIRVLGSSTTSAPVRARGADILVRLMLDAAKAISGQSDEIRAEVQLTILESLYASLIPLQEESRATSVTTYATDVDIHKIILEGLKGLLDECGETLLSGWNVIFGIIGTIFIPRRTSSEGSSDERTAPLGLTTRSPKLIRSAFNSLQLVCSDFLSALPKSCFLVLVDTLYKFCSQDDDLNIALTTVTFFWDLSNFLSRKNKALPITSNLVGNFDDASLVEKASHAEDAASDAALWMLLLIRLTTVTINDRLDLRNSAIQTLLRIFDAYGDQLTPEAWSVCIKSVIFRLMASIETELQALDHGDLDEKTRRDWHDTAVVVLNGISSLLSNYLDVLTAHPTFNSYWQQLLSHFATLLDLQVLEINTATFKALTQMLSHGQSGSKQNFDKTTIDLAWDLWARGIPIAKVDAMDKSPDNQNCLLAYVAALRDVYRLIQDDLTVERIRRMLALLCDVMQTATPGAFIADIDHATPLQTQVLDVLKMLRTDIPGAPSALIAQTSEFVSLAFTDGGDAAAQRATQKRTYVAMSKASMVILQSLIQSHAADTDIYNDGALLTALTALSKPIVFKYQFPIITKSEQPWKQATKSAIAALGATLSQLVALDIPRAMLQDMWNIIVVISNSITNADCEAPPDKVNISDDEDFDITSFTQLRELIVPALGAEVVPDKTRKLFTESLFRMSIIHAPAPTESSIIYGNSGGDVVGLSTLYQTRRGRTIDPPPSKRSRMAYVCLDELFSLVASHDEGAAPQINIQPPTPRFPPPRPSPGSAASENPQVLRIRLARTAAPYLILRAALTLRTYIAEQPLRGRMPQPLSQRKELARILGRLVDLRSEPKAIPDMANVESDGRKHLLRLYPLIVGASRVAARGGDAHISELLTQALEVVGAELGA
ncbi:putative endosomal peripheral membrane protein [Rosellinia necatrix]|uniref:Putative endosomal peripheral membrane protein n=1 Tax=Rosellinia necatrix TaxID=77044 RepID=A0A1W2TJI7_ROSNE|nr:putative endosomal peripheral membrane protein [Rosellinia necatrix]